MDWWAWMLIIAGYFLAFDIHKRVCQMDDRIKEYERQFEGYYRELVELRREIYRLERRRSSRE